MNSCHHTRRITTTTCAGVSIALLAGVLIFLTTCSNQNPHEPSVHPMSWLIPASADFHGRRVASYGIDFCQSCHGEDLRGGERATSCYACHALGGTCSGCHGTSLWGYAPPPDLNGNRDSNAIGVGAHLRHVIPSDLTNGYDCTECHVKPTELASPGHQDDGLPAEITFGALASTDGANPTWDRSVPSCSAVYCHGATLAGGTVEDPTWTAPEEDPCGKCHPIAEMSQGSHAAHLNLGIDCYYCHEGYGTDPERVVTSSHVDGDVDVVLSSTVGGSFDGHSCSGVLCHGTGNITPDWGQDVVLACNDCHGEVVSDLPDSLQGAPPPSLTGDTDTPVRGVGAHTAHVREGYFRAPYDCSECHVKPPEAGSPGHFGFDFTAEIEFGDLARTEDSDPVWDPDDSDGPSCLGTYCHGAALAGGTLTEPVWTIVFPDDVEPPDAERGDQAFCGSCHGIPPHTDFGPCNICHGNVVTADTTIAEGLGKTLHVNGQVDF